MGRTPAILAQSAALPSYFHVLIAQFFVNKYKDIILKFTETFSDKYGIEDLKIATQLIQF